MTINNVEFAQPLEDILALLRAELHSRGIQLLEQTPKESGHNIQMQCIYHGNGKERKPSMGIDKNTGMCHCFACQTTVNLPEFISNCFGYNDGGTKGWNWLLKNFVYLEKGDARHVKIDCSRGNNSIRDLGVQNYVTEEKLDSYRYEHPYWSKRHITDYDIIEQFDLGYDKETKCITFPNFNKEGDCEFIAKRSVKTKFFNYPADVSKMCYGIYQLYQLEEFPSRVWVTESMLDALRLWQLDIPAIALNGLGNDRQFKEMMQMPCRAFVLATDMDDRGQDARDRIKRNVKHKMFYEVFLPKGCKDISDCTDEQIKNIRIII